MPKLKMENASPKPLADVAAPSRNILLTARGKAWIEQFSLADRDAVRHLVAALSLISHTEFERSLDHLIRSEADTIDGPVALFAAREMKPNAQYFIDAAQREATSGPSDSVNAVGSGADLGSEARVAAIIRKIAKSDPDKFQNHPSIKSMRRKKCRAIFIIDDLIGSGWRINKFLNALWRDNKTLWSWFSRHQVSFHVMAYSATTSGQNSVRRTRYKPMVSTARMCPTMSELPWPKPRKAEVSKLCDVYATRTKAPGYSRGYLGTMALLVFEHGCPNNTPAILWADAAKGKVWSPLFPRRTVMPAEASVFPVEFARRDPVLTLLDVGQKKLSTTGFLSKGESGRTPLIALALIAKGVRRPVAISYATGLTTADTKTLVEELIEWGLVTQKRTISDTGLAELRFARQAGSLKTAVPSRGEDYYYPSQLRGPHG